MKEKRKSTKAEEAGIVAPAAGTTVDQGREEELSPVEPETETAHTADTEPAAATETKTPTIEEPKPTIADRREGSTIPSAIHTRTSMEDAASTRMRESAAAANAEDGLTTPLSPTSPKEGGKVKSWLKKNFSRRMSRGQKSAGKEEKSTKETDGKRGSFVGGAALTGASANNSTASLGAKSSSVRDVANASTVAPVSTTGGASVVDDTEEDRGRTTNRRDGDVSSLSDEPERHEDEEFQEARDDFDEDLAPPPTFVVEKSSSPVRSTKFTEDI